MLIPRVTRAAICLLALAGFACSQDDPVAPPPAKHHTLFVRYDGSGPYPTIQAALDASSDGDTIVLANGRYSGDGNRDLDFGGRSIVLRSESGDPENCMIDADGYYLSAPEPHFNLRFGLREAFGHPTGSAPVVSVENLGIEDGFEAVRCDSGSAPVFRNCEFDRCSAAAVCDASSPQFIDCFFHTNGIAVRCERGSSVTIRHCDIFWNWGYLYEAALMVESSSLRIEDSEIRGNNSALLGTRGYESSKSSVVVERCLFFTNGSVDYSGGPLSFAETDFKIVNSTFYQNESSYRGGGVFTVENDCIGVVDGCLFHDNYAEHGSLMYENDWETASSISFESCVVAFNRGGELFRCLSLAPSPSFQCTDMYGNAGGDWSGCGVVASDENGNTTVDPLFCYMVDGEFKLYPESPVVLNTACLRDGGWPVGCGPVFPASRVPARKR